MEIHAVRVNLSNYDIQGREPMCPKDSQEKLGHCTTKLIHRTDLMIDYKITRDLKGYLII